MKTMAYQVQAARDLIAENSPRRWENPMLRRWIMEGASDIARRTECLQTTKDFVATTGTQQYILPNDVIRVYRTEYTPPNQSQIYPLEYRDWNTMDEVWWTAQSQTVMRPEYFTMWGFPPQLTFVCYPTPESAGTFRLFYYRLPTPIDLSGAEDDALVEVPEGWDDLVTEYCIYMALRRDSDQRWQEAKALYDQKLEDLNEAALRWSDQAGMIATGQGFLPRYIWDESYPG